ncbi:phage tail tape measure protein [Rosenbergiella epipactidis]|uniref:phage tail tape measure protein n=1 Tax=Rosenbergiella epipactidis TaxID=1544694 RepID=UPI001F4EFF8C|nr:phage tail tape measure protein [Rosenbergiella epipactidis]
MAGKSLGTLTIDLIAEVGGFVRGMDKAERAAEQWQKKITKQASLVGTAIGATVSAVAAATISLIKATSEHVTETDRWAKSLGLSTSALMQWQYAAEKAGLSGDNIADIFKDLNDKIGDAVLNKSGEAAQALDTLGLSAKKLQNLSPDKQLLAIAQAMDGMNVAQKTNIYESLGNDLTKLMPLLNDGADGLNKLKQAAVEKGIAPSDDDIAKLTAVNKIFQDWEDSFEGFRNRFATGLAGIDLSSITTSFHSIENTLTSPDVLQGLANMISGLGKVVNLLAGAAKYANDISYGWGKTGETNQASDLDTLIKKRKELNESLKYSQSLLGTLDALGGNIRSPEEVKKSIAQNEALINSFQARQQAKGIVALTSPDPKAGIENLRLDKGDSNQNKKPPKPKIDHAALKLDNSFASIEQSYRKQIALIDITGKKSVSVTEQQKLAFDLSSGKLAGLNDLQKKRLESLAQEVDRLNSVKKANEDNAKVTAYVATLQQGNQNNRDTLNADLIGAGAGDKARNRLKQMASIRQDFNNQQLELNRQYSDDGNKDVYDKETAALSDALNQRLTDQQNYYDKIDQLNNDWSAGFMDGLQNSVDSANNLYQQMGGLAQSTFSGMADALTNFAITGKASFKDFTKSILSDLSRIAMEKALAGIVGSLFGGIGSSAASSSVGASGSGAMGLSTSYTGYDDGGFTGDGGKYDPAGIVHKGEFVFTKEATSRIGVDNLYKMMRGYSDGGYVGGEAVTPKAVSQLSGNSGVASVGNITVNVDSSGKASGGSATDGQGIGKQIQSAVINTINEQATKQGTPLWRAIKGR